MTTVDGTLQLRNGQIGVASGNNFVFVPMLGRYVGFIDGLQEGARVSIEGIVVNGNVLMPARLNLNGRNFDLLSMGGGNSFGGGFGGFGDCCSDFGGGNGRGRAMLGGGRGMRNW
jgi:hypothetical protein